MVGANQDVVSRCQVHYAEKGRSWDVAREARNSACLQINGHGVAKTLRHEGDALIVGRDDCPLAEMGEDFNVRRQMLERIFGTSCALFLGEGCG